MRPRERKAAAVPMACALSPHSPDDLVGHRLVDDVTGPSLAAQALRRQATHDTLTGLPNRALLNDRLRRALREATQKCTNAALLVMDLDQFKEIDDALGHHAGDQLLVGLSRRLEDMLGDSGLIAWPGTSRRRRRCTRPSRTSVDDFGTGHSALAYLEHLPIDEIKIDQSFVGELRTSRADETIVRTIIDLGHNLGLTVVAEGVEDDDTLQRLRSSGCDRAQGYHLSPPITCHDVPSAIAAAHTSVGRTAVARQ